MKLSKETKAFLKNFATINNGVVLNPGNHIMTRSANGATHAEATIVEDITEQMAIIDLTGFLSVLSIAGDEAEITIGKDETISIKSDRSEINFPLAEESMVVTPKRSIKFPDPQIEFDITADEYIQLLRISRGMGCNTLVLMPQDGKIVIASYNKDADTELQKPLYVFEAAEYAGTDNFRFIINITNLKLIPQDYTVMLWRSGDMFASKWKGTQVDYVVAVEADSDSDFS